MGCSAQEAMILMFQLGQLFFFAAEGHLRNSNNNSDVCFITMETTTDNDVMCQYSLESHFCTFSAFLLLEDKQCLCLVNSVSVCM